MTIQQDVATILQRLAQFERGEQIHHDVLARLPWPLAPGAARILHGIVATASYCRRGREALPAVSGPGVAWA